VHSVVSLDFAVGNTPGFHSTLFPPYFVAGALFSGFAMVLTLAIPMRHFFALHDFITTRHLENAAKIMLATGWIVAYGYFMEIFTAYISADPFESYVVENRMTGPYAPVFWLLIACNVLAPQVLWWRRARRNAWLLFVVSLVVGAGMWMERFVIIVASLHRDYLPSAWGMYAPTGWDWTFLAGTVGVFATLFLLFVRFLPAISIFEMRELVRESARNARS